MSVSSFYVDQAVFSTTLRGTGENNVSLEKATAGVSSDLFDYAWDLARCVALFNGSYDENNLFGVFHDSGALILGRLTPGPDSKTFYFQCLFMDSALFYRLGADPVKVICLALNTAQFRLYKPGNVVSQFRIDEEAPCVDCNALKRAVGKYGLTALLVIVQSIFEKESVCFWTNSNVLTILSVIFGLLPFPGRSFFDFTVGIDFRRMTFRLTGINKTCQKALSGNSSEVCALDLDKLSADLESYPIEHCWTRYVKILLTAQVRERYTILRIMNEFLRSKMKDGLIKPFVDPKEDVIRLVSELCVWSDDFDPEEEQDPTDEDYLEDLPWKEFEDSQNEDEWRSNSDENDRWEEEKDWNGEEWRRCLDTLLFASEENGTFHDESQTDVFDKDQEHRRGLISDFAGLPFVQSATGMVSNQDFCCQDDEDRKNFSDIFNPAVATHADEEDPLSFLTRPVSILNSEYPELADELNRMLELMKGTYQGSIDSRSKFKDFWSELVDSLEEKDVLRIRHVCLNEIKRGLYLRPSDDMGSVDATVYLIDVANIIMGQ